MVAVEVGLRVQMGQPHLRPAFYGGSPQHNLPSLWASDLPVGVAVFHLLHPCDALLPASRAVLDFVRVEPGFVVLVIGQLENAAHGDMVVVKGGGHVEVGDEDQGEEDDLAQDECQLLQLSVHIYFTYFVCPL